MLCGTGDTGRGGSKQAVAVSRWGMGVGWTRVLSVEVERSRLM